MDCILCDKCKALIKPNEKFHCVTITGETYVINPSNIKEFNMSQYTNYELCNSCYSKLAESLKIGLVD